MNNIEREIKLVQPQPRGTQTPEISSGRAAFSGLLLAASTIMTPVLGGCTLDRKGTNWFSGNGGHAAAGGSGLEGGAGGNETGGNGGTGGTGNEGGIGGNLPGGTGGIGLDGGGGTGLEGGTGGEGGTPCIPTTEVCDGIDNNCNNSVDEDDPALGDPCDTGNKGECAAGTKICDQVKDKLICLQTNQSKNEACTGGLDEDCDGLIDCADPSCTGDLACCSSVTALGDSCYKWVKFPAGGKPIDPSASTGDNFQCSNGNVSGLYCTGDRAAAWENDSELVFTSTEIPVAIEVKCSPYTLPATWGGSTLQVDAPGYGPANVSVNAQTFTVTSPVACQDYDFRITW